MTIVDGRWVPERDTGDDRHYPNHLHLDELVDEEFDLIVVGGGGSGAVAAIEAHDLGASVVVLEKTESPGGSTQASGGTIRTVTDRAGTASHFFALAQGATPRPVIDAFVEGLAELPDWLAAHGGELEIRDEAERAHGDPRYFPISRGGSSFPNFPDSAALAPRALLRPVEAGRKTGPALWDLLAHNLAEREVPLVLGARVVHLVRDGARGRVHGVEVAAPGGNVVLRARRGVVLCSGGFAYDDETMTQYYGLPLPTVCPVGRATGDGIRLAQEAGADLWHMNAVAASVGYRLPDLEAGIQAKMPAHGFVMVDQHARRYVNETALENHSAVHAMLVQDTTTGEYLRVPSYVILDETTRLAGRLAHLPHGENRHYPWSADNLAEIGRGWISRADDLDGLAGALGLPAERLGAVVGRFNAVARGKGVDEFERPADEMAPIATPPFYGAAVYPIIVNTQGGPRRDADGRIVSADGSPVPGLFGAGELGSIWNRLYPGAGNICECIISGRLAARAALR
ncbi:MAG TPA: FAD-dependent oxidoreductase [Acidimicrobiales bacterium]|nr:FAD-dependent oxidoreductase [Acidimicrobiales bacterium]